MNLKSYNTMRQRLEQAIILAGSDRLQIGTLKTWLRRLERKMIRQSKSETKALAYRAVALAGGGPRERARRMRQIFGPDARIIINRPSA